jgi:transposase
MMARQSASMTQQETSPMKQNMSVVGIDLAKRTFHLVGMDATGQILFRKRLCRDALRPFIVPLPPVVMGMEACGGAHYWARRFREPGHEVKLMAPQLVKPYVKSNTNATRDAEAIGEAVTRPTMRFVPVKGRDQQDIQSLHRARERLRKARTALVKAIRGLLSAYGMVLPTSVRKFRQAFVSTLEAERSKLTELRHALCEPLLDAFLEVEKRLVYDDEKRTTMGQSHPACQRRLTIPGSGPLTATAFVAAMSAAEPCKNGRQCAAWLGLVPRQHTTGGKARLLGRRKRGDGSVRKLLVHGARATVRWVGSTTARRSQWIRACVERRGTNRTAVAVAKKNARIAWVLLRRQQDSQPVTASRRSARATRGQHSRHARCGAAHANTMEVGQRRQELGEERERGAPSPLMVRTATVQRRHEQTGIACAG